MSGKDLSYTGPNKEYKPQPGSETSKPQASNTNLLIAKRSVEELKNNLLEVINMSNTILMKCEDELSVFSIDLTKNDKRLQAAEAVWADLQTTENKYVSYKQITEIQEKPNRSSKYLVEEFKKELRKPNGSSALDIKNIVNIILQESKRIYDLVSQDFFGSDISAEKRLIELFLEFTPLVKSRLIMMDSFFGLSRKERNKALPSNEIDILTEEDAKKYQSLFSLSVNGLNDEIDKDVDYLHRFFTNSSDYFYTKIIAPLMRLKTQSPKETSLRSSSTTLDSWSNDVERALDRNVVTTLYDVLDRTEKFDTAIFSLQEKISLRENYLSYIRQLQEKGLKTPTDLVENVETPSLTQRTQNSQLINDHSNLVDREDKKTHEQYLLKSNDYLKGDLTFAKSVTIDGVDLSDHTHSSEDGSSLIDGKYIKEKSITTNLPLTEYEDKPSNLQLIGISGSQTEVAAKLFWLTKNNNTINEIQVSKIQPITYIDPGQEEPETPEVPRIPGYIPPFESYDPLYIEWITEIDYELFFN